MNRIHFTEVPLNQFFLRVRCYLYHTTFKITVIHINMLICVFKFNIAIKIVYDRFDNYKPMKSMSVAQIARLRQINKNKHYSKAMVLFIIF
jgi:hypothetical protein